MLRGRRNAARIGRTERGLEQVTYGYSLWNTPRDVPRAGKGFSGQLSDPAPQARVDLRPGDDVPDALLGAGHRVLRPGQLRRADLAQRDAEQARPGRGRV